MGLGRPQIKNEKSRDSQDSHAYDKERKPSAAFLTKSDVAGTISHEHILRIISPFVKNWAGRLGR
jgi:hypothetical protein